MTRAKPRVSMFFWVFGVVVVLYVCASVATVLLVRSTMRTQAIHEAEDDAKLILDRNLATHAFYTHELKPAIFPLLEKHPDAGQEYFEPAWMSSTFAVRRINRYFDQMQNREWYYKECAINARSPENEADPFEKAFLLRAAADPSLTFESGERVIDGEPMLEVLRRGESMEQSCLRCHSTPEVAPRGMVERYGSDRSFGREVGDLVSATSIRVPLAAAYADADRLAWNLSILLMGVLLVMVVVKYLLHRQVFFKPLQEIGQTATAIATDEHRLGQQVALPRGKELREVADAFNHMSTALRAERDSLDRQVEQRTAELRHEIEVRTQAEQNLRESESRYQTLFASMTEGFALHEIVLDDQARPCDYRFIEVNPAFEELTGLKAADITGRTVREVLPETESYWIEAYGRVALTGEPAQFENYAGELGKHFHMLAFSPRKGQFATLFVDITERKVAEEQRLKLEGRMLHAQKLESLGVLAGGIAHDFNNLLMAILGYAELALRDLPTGSTPRANVEEVKRASLRAADLTSQMLAYSGKGRFVLESVNLNQLVEEMARLLEVSKSKRTLLRFDLADNLPAIKADSSQLGQVVMNLITNAAEAIGDKSGVIALATGAMEFTEDYLDNVRLDTELPPGRYVYLEVSDTGCGMDKQTRERIFEPFFTTKFTGRGLGLSALMGIIRGHSGGVKVYSEPGKGTTFKVFLPCIETVTGDREEKKAAAAADDWKPRGTVLIADDEETVRTVTKMMLTSSGFEVLTAADGREAVELYQHHRDEIVIVLLDMTMPRLSGEEAFRELRQINPDVRVILSSGYNEQEAINRFTGKGLAGFIQKPYGLKQLLDVVRIALEP